jgi:hypothetical protein
MNELLQLRSDIFLRSGDYISSLKCDATNLPSTCAIVLEH